MEGRRGGRAEGRKDGRKPGLPATMKPMTRDSGIASIKSPAHTRRKGGRGERRENGRN